MPTVASKDLFQKYILSLGGKNASLSSSYIQKSKILGGYFAEYSSTIIKLK